MTENQERELFKTLATLVTGVNAIQVNVKELKADVQILKTEVKEIRLILNDHSQSLNRSEAKTDSIA